MSKIGKSALNSKNQKFDILQHCRRFFSIFNECFKFAFKRNFVSSQYFLVNCALFMFPTSPKKFCIFPVQLLVFFPSLFKCFRKKKNVPPDIHSRNHQLVYVLLSRQKKNMYLAVTQIKIIDNLTYCNFEKYLHRIQR